MGTLQGTFQRSGAQTRRCRGVEVSRRASDLGRVHGGERTREDSVVPSLTRRQDGHEDEIEDEGEDEDEDEDEDAGCPGCTTGPDCRTRAGVVAKPRSAHVISHPQLLLEHGAPTRL